MNLELLKHKASVCELCELCKGRNKPVFDKGNSKADIMICGMVPAREENKTGIPFIGRTGKLLDYMLNDLSLNLNNVYITNLVKCYLSSGLILKSKWIKACTPYLISQIELVNPKVIISLGKDASSTILGIKRSVSLAQIRSKKIYNYNGIKVIPTYHPSYLLGGGGKNHKKYGDVMEDFSFAKKCSY